MIQELLKTLTPEETGTFVVGLLILVVLLAIFIFTNKEG